MFPREAKLAMEQAHADTTLEFAGLSSTNGLCGNLRGVDLNELPSDQVKRLKERLVALHKTGNHEFSLCCCLSYVFFCNKTKSSFYKNSL